MKRKKRISSGFLLEIAIDHWEGLSLQASAEKHRVSIGTVHNTRKHPDYPAVYAKVDSHRTAERLRQSEKGGDK